MATKKVYWNTIAQLAAKFSTAFISIFLIKVLTNYLSVADYGLYSKIYNYMSIFAVIADLGLFTITIREISNNKENKAIVQSIIGNIMTIRMTLGILIIFLSVGIAYFLPGYNSNLALTSIFITGFFVYFGLMNSAILSLLQAYLKTEYSFVSTTVGKLANFIFIIIIVFVLYPKAMITGNPDMQFNAFLWIMFAGVFGNIIMTLMIYKYSIGVEKINFEFHLPQIKSLIKESIPYGLAMFLNAIFFKVDVIILSLMESSKNADESIALYSVPGKIVEVGMMFGGLFLQSMLPLFTQAIKHKNYDEMNGYVKKSYKLLFAFGVAIVGFSLVNGYDILALVVSKDYLDHTKYIFNSLDAYKITVFIFLFYFISSIFTYLLIAAGEQGRLLKINFYITIVNIIGNIILIPRLSFIGSSISTLISQIILLVYTYIASRHVFRFNFIPSFTIGTLLIGGIAAIGNFIV
ncbi:oligosaccharide flippase family protein, partial [Candidatus Gracilibacteria bacterium]|nr:oligosaccharide flippase family protein [Candidatus Gracilibacteria bacterium]